MYLLQFGVFRVFGGTHLCRFKPSCVKDDFPQKGHENAFWRFSFLGMRFGGTQVCRSKPSCVKDDFPHNGQENAFWRGSFFFLGVGARDLDGLEETNGFGSEDSGNELCGAAAGAVCLDESMILLDKQ